jgi:hypothetical protein
LLQRDGRAVLFQAFGEGDFIARDSQKRIFVSQIHARTHG